MAIIWYVVDDVVVGDDELNLLKTCFCFDDGVVGVVLVPIISLLLGLCHGVHERRCHA